MITRRRMMIAGFAVLWLAVTGGMSYVVLTERAAVIHGAGQVRMATSDASHHAGAALRGAWQDAAWATSGVTTRITDMRDGAVQRLAGIRKGIDNVAQAADRMIDDAGRQVSGLVTQLKDVTGDRQTLTATAPISTPELLKLSEIMERRAAEEEARAMAAVAPASGGPESSWKPDVMTLDVEAVLVPRQVTVVSSSQDGRIASIPVDHGDHFHKGDILVAYDCAHIQAEADIAKIEKKFTTTRVKGSDALFKLEIISDLDRIGAQVEDQKAAAKGALAQSRLKDCTIRAEFDGRVTNRLANPGEYTRTDRVLLEVASEEALQAEFLVPSKWLRWINIGAPVQVSVTETERSYDAKVTRIYGEVDPVSQSIQMIATLDPYEDPLLPGMSGKANISIDAIRSAGVRGYLEARAGGDDK